MVEEMPLVTRTGTPEEVRGKRSTPPLLNWKE